MNRHSCRTKLKKRAAAAAAAAASVVTAENIRIEESSPDATSGFGRRRVGKGPMSGGPEGGLSASNHIQIEASGHDQPLQGIQRNRLQPLGDVGLARPSGGIPRFELNQLRAAKGQGQARLQDLKVGIGWAIRYFPYFISFFSMRPT